MRFISLEIDGETRDANANGIGYEMLDERNWENLIVSADTFFVQICASGHTVFLSSKKKKKKQIQFTATFPRSMAKNGDS